MAKAKKDKGAGARKYQKELRRLKRQGMTHKQAVAAYKRGKRAARGHAIGPVMSPKHKARLAERRRMDEQLAQMHKLQRHEKAKARLARMRAAKAAKEAERLAPIRAREAREALEARMRAAGLVVPSLYQSVRDKSGRKGKGKKKASSKRKSPWQSFVKANFKKVYAALARKKYGSKALTPAQHKSVFRATMKELSRLFKGSAPRPGTGWPYTAKKGKKKSAAKKSAAKKGKKKSAAKKKGKKGRDWTGNWAGHSRASYKGHHHGVGGWYRHPRLHSKAARKGRGLF